MPGAMIAHAWHFGWGWFGMLGLIVFVVVVAFAIVMDRRPPE
jgi:uncharacterized membrane protein